MLNDPVTAQYTHTLTVTGILPGLYTCTVANNKPSSHSTSRNVTITGTLPKLIIIHFIAINLLTIYLAPSGPPASLHYATSASLHYATSASLHYATSASLHYVTSALLYAMPTSTCLFCTPPVTPTLDTNNSNKIPYLYYFTAGIAVTTIISILTGAVIVRKIYLVLTERKHR